jgi:hypothetical protein
MDLELKLDDETLADVLTSALEGGIGYWGTIVQFIKPEKLAFRSDAKVIYRHIDYPMNEGGGIVIAVEDDGKYTLDLEALKRGVKIMHEKYTRHYADMVSECNADATTGDVLVQCALFGEIVYG